MFKVIFKVIDYILHIKITRNINVYGNVVEYSNFTDTFLI